MHRDSVVACVRVSVDGRVRTDKHRFTTTSAGLRELAGWLAEREVTTVAMEATGVYWKRVYDALEGLFEEVWLVNAHHVRNVPGRKSDMADAEWLADVVAHGMVRRSLVPPPPIRALRDLTRYRKSQVDMRVAEVQRLEKVLHDAGIKLSSVASKVLTQSGRNMIEALIAGERDTKVLANMAMRRMRPKIAQLELALEGPFDAHHAALCRQVLAHVDFLSASIDAVTGEIAARMAPYAQAAALLQTMPGVAAQVAEAVVAESGADMSRFPTPQQFAAWAGVAPASKESAGKRQPAGTRHGAPWLRRYLIEAARSASTSKGSYFAAQYRHITARRGPNKAAVAVAHSMAVAMWHMLTKGEPYRDLGGDWFQRKADPDAEARRLVRRLRELGHDVSLDAA